MRKKINIFTNVQTDFFFKQLLNDYDLTLYKITDLYKLDIGGVIFFTNISTTNSLETLKLKNEYLFIGKKSSKENLTNKNIKFIQIPNSIYKIKNAVKKFILNQKIYFGDLVIFNKKLYNNKSTNKCFLTDLENNILTFIISEKVCNKNSIKNNVLNLKTEIQTNSLESHLTRIRKKIEKLNSKIKIQSRGEFVSIIY